MVPFIGVSCVMMSANNEKTTNNRRGWHVVDTAITVLYMSTGRDEVCCVSSLLLAFNSCDTISCRSAFAVSARSVFAGANITLL